jgi:hypothetical protein
MRAEGNILPSLDVLCLVLGRLVSVAHSHLDFCPAATNPLLSQVFGASHVPFVMWIVCG